MNLTNEIEFLVGMEKRLTDVLDEAQILPLFKSAVKAGIGFAAVVDDKNIPLWTLGPCPPASVVGEENWDARCILLLEGEPVGAVCLRRGQVNPHGCEMMAHLIGEAFNSIMTNNLKRMLTTEIHTRVVNQSYDELLESNRQLAESEKKYRDLAENLELRVQGRTEELKRAYARLLQQEKMASIGQLAAGVAHEINNPNGYILSNLNTLRKYVGRMTSMLEYYRGLHGVAGAEKWRELKLDTVLGDVDELLDQTVSGAEKVKQIVFDLKGFAHVEDMGAGEVDINHQIVRTLGVLAGEIPGDACIIKQFGDLPVFRGNGALLCQVFLNLLRNAFQARSEGLQLIITTEHENDTVRICFSDNGPGVPDEIHGRIFEPFFTTRDVGQGTGLGLTVAYEIVTGYGGTLEVENGKKGGAVFLIHLPATGRTHGQVR
jgi:signal transduction histidine kinase